MRIVSEFLSAREMAKIVSDVSGKPVHVQEISHEVFDSFKGNPMPEEIHSKCVPLSPLNAFPRFPDMLIIRAHDYSMCKRLHFRLNSAWLTCYTVALFYFNKPPFRDPALSHRIYPERRTFRSWVQENVNKVLP